MRLSQWLSPSFPVSAYAYSHGLEAEIAAGRLADAEAVEAWLRTILRAGAGRSDAILMLATRKPGADLDALSDLARALAGSAERLEETEAQGAAIARTLREMGQGDGVARPYPVAIGAASAGLDLPDATVAALYLQSFIGNLVSAAVRFVPLGQAEGQRVAAALHPVIAGVVEDVVVAGLDGIGQAVFGADLAAMEHETQEVRLFRT
jgi:urease accessory protein